MRNFYITLLMLVSSAALNAMDGENLHDNLDLRQIAEPLFEGLNPNLWNDFGESYTLSLDEISHKFGTSSLEFTLIRIREPGCFFYKLLNEMPPKDRNIFVKATIPLIENLRVAHYRTDILWGLKKVPIQRLERFVRDVAPIFSGLREHVAFLGEIVEILIKVEENELANFVQRALPLIKGQFDYKCKDILKELLVAEPA